MATNITKAQLLEDIQVKQQEIKDLTKTVNRLNQVIKEQTEDIAKQEINIKADVNKLQKSIKAMPKKGINLYLLLTGLAISSVGFFLPSSTMSFLGILQVDGNIVQLSGFIILLVSLLTTVQEPLTKILKASKGGTSWNQNNLSDDDNIR